MLHRLIHLPMTQLRIMLHPVFGALHRKSADSGSLASLRQRVFFQRHAPRFDLLVQFFLVLQASGDAWQIFPNWPTTGRP